MKFKTNKIKITKIMFQNIQNDVTYRVKTVGVRAQTFT